VNLVPIGYLRGPFSEKFGTPRQPGLVPEIDSVVELLSPWNNDEVIRGLSGHSHVWLLFGFHRNASVSPTRATVRPPRLGGNERMGVFATRSPYRPNPIGLSLVAIREVTAGRIVVGGADLVDGTPIYDIKPWLPWADAPLCTKSSGGFAAVPPASRLDVHFDPVIAQHDLAPTLAQILALDPRPAYQRDEPERVYGMEYAGHEVLWRVDDSTGSLQVFEIRKSVDKGPE